MCVNDRHPFLSFLESTIPSKSGNMTYPCCDKRYKVTLKIENPSSISSNLVTENIKQYSASGVLLQEDLKN